jgi:CDP-diacylglycerol--serine O-phosphatidyltransferase
VRHPIFSAVMLFLVGGLMVSTLPSWSFKNFKVPSNMVLPLLLGTGGYIAFLVTEPWAALSLGGLLYFGMLYFSARSYARLKREAEAMRDAAEGPAAETVRAP